MGRFSQLVNQFRLRSRIDREGRINQTTHMDRILLLGGWDRSANEGGIESEDS